MSLRITRLLPGSAAALFALALLPAGAPARAELIVVDGQVQVREAGVETPRRGMRMSAVEARFGAPRDRAAAVGNPPITRWEYDGFTVYFENDIVLHSVSRGG
jgi:hypothetical protein